MCSTLERRESIPLGKALQKKTSCHFEELVFFVVLSYLLDTSSLTLQKTFLQKKTPTYFVLSKATRCLKNTEKVSFNIASEASYVYILSGQKFIKNAKNAPVWQVFENLKLAVKQCYQTGQF